MMGRGESGSQPAQGCYLNTGRYQVPSISGGSGLDVTSYLKSARHTVGPQEGITADALLTVTFRKEAHWPTKVTQETVFRHHRFKVAMGKFLRAGEGQPCGCSSGDIRETSAYQTRESAFVCQLQVHDRWLEA